MDDVRPPPAFLRSSSSRRIPSRRNHTDVSVTKFSTPLAASQIVTNGFNICGQPKRSASALEMLSCLQCF